MPVISPFTMIKNRIEASKEKSREERRAKIIQMAEKVALPLDQLDLSCTGRDYSRGRKKTATLYNAAAATANLAATGATAGILAPVTLPFAAAHLGAMAVSLTKSGNEGYKKVNAKLLERTDAEDVRYGAVKKYFQTRKQAIASATAGMEKLDRHLQESPEDYKERILDSGFTLGTPGGGPCFATGPHLPERMRILQNLSSHGDGRVYSVPFYAGGKSTLIVKTTSREKALELKEKALTINNPETHYSDDTSTALRQSLLANEFC
jgi:hypothetical protein